MRILGERGKAILILALILVVSLVVVLFSLKLFSLKAVYAVPVEASHVKLVGFNDLQGRDSLQVTCKGDWAYVGHHNGYEYNPLTAAWEWNGRSVCRVDC